MIYAYGLFLRGKNPRKQSLFHMIGFGTDEQWRGNISSPFFDWRGYPEKTAVDK
jgi:hypothetical protein